MTIRHGITMEQVGNFIQSYQSDPKVLRRIDINSLMKQGKSRTIIEESGMNIETIIVLEK